MVLFVNYAFLKINFYFNSTDKLMIFYEKRPEMIFQKHSFQNWENLFRNQFENIDFNIRVFI